MARILIVDDEPDILLMLRINLEAEGHQTAIAADGERGLERLDGEDFDLMLLDVMMPVMDGWQVLEALQERPGAPKVIVVSAKSTARDIGRALELGAAEYLVKPFASDELCRLVDQILAWSSDEVDAHRTATLAGLS